MAIIKEFEKFKKLRDDKMVEINFEDFENGVIEFLNILEARITELENCLAVIPEKIQERDNHIAKALELRDNRIEGIASIVFMLICRVKGEPISRQERETISDIMGFKWTSKDEKAFQDCATA